MYLAFCIAALAQSTLGPRVQKPWLSGGLTCIRATSNEMIFRRNKCGISLRKTGVKSARPSLMGLRQLAPMKNELLLNISETNEQAPSKYSATTYVTDLFHPQHLLRFITDITILFT